MLAEEVDPENFTRNEGDVQDDIKSEEEVEVAFDETTNLRSCTITGASTYTAPDASNCENLVSKGLVKALKLQTEQHHNPYKLGWVKKGPEVLVIFCYEGNMMWMQYIEVRTFSARVMNTSQDIPEEMHSDSVGSKTVHNGGSVLGVIEDFIRIGQAMGYAMEGSVKDLATIIGQQGDGNVIR
ncbi:hypothetical protein Tco_1159968 [Tanacetum coccineum]